MPYETEVLENAPPGTTVFNTILVTDKDTFGENLNISCVPPQNSFIQTTITPTTKGSNPCSM